MRLEPSTTLTTKRRRRFARRWTLDAHEAGLYRSVCRVLMPEIERVSRKELHGDGMQQRITNQKLLQELTAELPLSSVEPAGFYNLNLFRRLSNHANFLPGTTISARQKNM